MSEWRTLRMRDVMVEFHDGPHATPPPADSGPIFLGIKNITESGLLDLSDVRHISEEDFDRWTRRATPQPGDVVFTYEATLHRYALIPDGFHGCLGRRLALIRPNPSVVLPRYLHFAMLGPEWRKTVAERVITGATVDRIPIIDFPNFPIDLPDIETQSGVVEILGALDDLIENNRRRIALLEGMAQAIYREWFAHFRYPGHEDGRLVNSPLGPIPAGWDTARLGDVIELRYGKALRASDRNGGPVAVVGSSGIVGWHDEPLVDGPTIVVGRKGNVGSVTWVHGDSWPIDTTYYVTTDLPLQFAYRLLSGIEFIDSHAAVPGLSREHAYSVQVLRPNAEVAARFDAVASKLSAMIAVLEGEKSVTSGVRDALLPRLVTGEIDVSKLELDALLEQSAA
jgi:type I restriction enzyme S subunit